MHSVSAMKSYLEVEAKLYYVIEGEVQKCSGSIGSIANLCVLLELRKVYFKVFVNGYAVFKKNTEFKYWLGADDDFPKGH